MDHTLIYIVERDLFVSQDMKDVLCSVLPSVDCRVVDSISRVRDEVRVRGEPWAILVSANADGSFDLSEDTREWLSAQHVIAFDVTDPALYPTWEHLKKPFSEEQLVDAVRRLLNTRPIRAAE